ncbi:MAG: glycosyltransferase family 9 protein [Smithella sp.]
MIVADQHKIDIPIKKILIVQLGDIGDIVWGIPAYASVKRAYPQAELFLVTRHPYGDLLLDDPHITGIFQVKKNFHDSFSLLMKLRKLRLDLVIDLRADDRGAMTSFFTGAPIRAALFYPGMAWRNRLFTHLVIEPLPKKERVYGAAEQSLQIIRGLGIMEESAVPQIAVSTKSEQKVREIIANEKIISKNGWISINPFSRWSYKEWDIEKWRLLINYIWENYDLPTVIIGSAEERKRAEKLSQNTSIPVYNLAGLTSLWEMPALLKMSHLHIGVDSAAPHIAAAVGTPTVTIFGPSDWRDWAPPGGRNIVIVTDMSCSPCHQKGCDGRGRSLCMEKMDIKEVQDVVEKALGKIVSCA